MLSPPNASLKRIMSIMTSRQGLNTRGLKKRRCQDEEVSTSPPGAETKGQPPPPLCATTPAVPDTCPKPIPKSGEGSSSTTLTCPSDAGAGAGTMTSTSGIVPRWRSAWTPLHTTAVDLNTVLSKDFVLVSAGKGVYGSVYRVLVVAGRGSPGNTGRLTTMTVRRMFDARKLGVGDYPADKTGSLAVFNTNLVLKVSQVDKDPSTVFERLNTAINDAAIHRLAATQCPDAVPAIHAAHVMTPNHFVTVIAAKSTTLGLSLAKKDDVVSGPRLVKSALRAVSGLNSVGILHLDVKPSNILVDSKTMTATMCDFGLAVRLDAVNCRQFIVGRRAQDRGVRGHKPDVVTPVFRPPDLHACHAVAGAAASDRKFMSAVRVLDLTGNTDAWCMGRIADSLAKGHLYGIPKRDYIDPKTDHTAIVSDPAYQETSVGIRSIHTVSLADPHVMERSECATIAACLLTLRPTLRVAMDACASDAVRQYADLSTRPHPAKVDPPVCLADTHTPGGGAVVLTVPMPSRQEASALYKAAVDSNKARRASTTGACYFLERLLREAVQMKVSARTVIVAMALTEVYGTWGSGDVQDSMLLGPRVNAMLRFAAAREQIMSPAKTGTNRGAFPACVSLVQRALETNPDPLLSALPTADLWCVSLTGVATFLRRSLSRGSVIVEDIQAEVNACNLGRTPPTFVGVSWDPAIKRAIQTVAQTVA